MEARTNKRAAPSPRLIENAEKVYYQHNSNYIHLISFMGLSVVSTPSGAYNDFQLRPHIDKNLNIFMFE